MLRSLLVALILSFPALADMTLRYGMDLKPNPMMPPMATDAIKGQLGEMFDKGMIYSFKDNGATYMKFGPTVTLFDPNTRLNTTLLIDKKVFSRAEPGNLDAMNKDAMEQLKKLTAGGGFKVSSDNSGRTRKIGDYEAEEKLITMEMSLKGAVPQGQQLPPGMDSMKIKIAMWFPTSVENETKPMLKKYMELRQLGLMANDPMQQIGKLFGQDPQLAAQMQNMMMESSKGGLLLLMEEAIIMPGATKMFAQMAGKKPEEVDPDDPMMTVVMTMKEFREGEVQDELFKIPEDFKEVKPDEMSKLMVEAQMERMKPKNPATKKPEDAEKKDEKKQ